MKFKPRYRYFFAIETTRRRFPSESSCFASLYFPKNVFRSATRLRRLTGLLRHAQNTAYFSTQSAFAFRTVFGLMSGNQLSQFIDTSLNFPRVSHIPIIRSYAVRILYDTCAAATTDSERTPGALPLLRSAAAVDGYPVITPVLDEDMVERRQVLSETARICSLAKYPSPVWIVRSKGISPDST